MLAHTPTLPSGSSLTPSVSSSCAFRLNVRRVTVIMMVMMKMMREKRFPIENPCGGHTRRWVQRRENKQKQNAQTPDTNTHKQTFISKYVSVAQTPQCTHCTTRELVCGRNDCNGKLNDGEKNAKAACVNVADGGTFTSEIIKLNHVKTCRNKTKYKSHDKLLFYFFI